MAQSLLGMRLVLNSGKRASSFWSPLRSHHNQSRHYRVFGVTTASLLFGIVILSLLVRSFNNGQLPQEAYEEKKLHGQAQKDPKQQAHERKIEDNYQEHAEGQTQNNQQQAQGDQAKGDQAQGKTTTPEQPQEPKEEPQVHGQETASQGGDTRQSEGEGAVPMKEQSRGEPMSIQAAMSYFSKVLLVVSFEREHNEVGRVVVPLLYSIYSRVFPNIHFVSEGHTLSPNTKRPRSRPTMDNDHLMSLNYGVLTDLPSDHAGEDLEGILWISCTTVLNYWNFNGANKDLLWFPSFKHGPWSLVGPETKGGWIEDQNWQEKLKGTLERLDPDAKGCLTANLANLGLTTGHPDTVDDFAAKGPDQIFYIPKRHFFSMQLLAGAFHGAGIPSEVAVPSMLLALETPLNTDPILNSAVHLRGIVREGHIHAAKSAYQSNKPAFWPWPFEGEGSLKEMVSRMAEGDSSLKDIADGLPSVM